MKKIFINGSFDLLHIGHLDMINYAKSLGNYLLVAIDTDERITKHKGKDRPVLSQHNRFAIMANLKAVDEVKIFDTDQDLITIIKYFSPDIMVKGSDWRDKEVIGKEYCGDIIFYERVNNESTTNTIKNFINRR